MAFEAIETLLPPPFPLRHRSDGFHGRLFPHFAFPFSLFMFHFRASLETISAPSFYGFIMQTEGGEGEKEETTEKRTLKVLKNELPQVIKRTNSSSWNGGLCKELVRDDYSLDEEYAFHFHFSRLCIFDSLMKLNG